MGTNKDILTKLKKRQKPEVPAGFFDQFVDDLMDEIQPNQTVLDGLIKSKKPDVPAGYFSQVLAPLKDVTSEKREDAPLATLVKSKRPDIPANFFDHFKEEIMAKLKPDQSGGRIISLSLLYTVGSVAAILAIIFLTINFNNNTNITREVTNSSSTIDTLVEEVIYDDYLASMDENELIDYVVENNITVENKSTSYQYDNYIDYSEDELLDYYLDL